MNIMKTINYKQLIPYIVILILLRVVYFGYQRSVKLSNDLKSENKLRLAMIDTVSVYKNQRDELVSEKRTLQFDLNEKEFKNLELVERIKETQKRNATLEKKVTVLAAALIESQIIIDSLQKSRVAIFEKDSSIVFTSTNPDTIKYKLKVQPVLTIKGKPPVLTFMEFNLPNKQFVEFHWKNDNKEGYPISFSTTNTNPYYKTVNIESYIIPEFKPDVVKPTFWKKVGNGAKMVGSKLIYVGIGIGVGFLIF